MSFPVYTVTFHFPPRATRLAARLAGGLLALAPLACPGGYLPKVGPAPLRYVEELPRRVRVPAAPESAATPATPDTNQTQTAVATMDAALTNDAPQAIVLTAKSPLPWFDWLTPVTPPPPARSEAPSEDVPSPHAEITPQAMIPFFQNRTSERGNREVATWGAVTFTPPVPGQRPESKAAYQQQPPTPTPPPAANAPAPRP